MEKRCDTIEAILREKFSHWSVPTMVVGVSGGLDSMVLLEGLYRLYGNVNVSVLHINHGLRGEESGGDEDFVREQARIRGLPCIVERLVWEDGEKPSQEACRIKRLDVFQKYTNGHIVLAHHLEDQAETIFQRILRGTGPNGFGAMEEKRGFFLRPLLSVSRSQIQSSARTWKVLWREDSSNENTKYERNWIRKKIFPLLEQRRPGFQNRLVSLAKDIKDLTKEPVELTIASNPAGEVYQQRELLEAPNTFFIQHFQCQRKHIIFIKDLLEKGRGKLSLPSGVLWLSCGYCLWTKNLEKWEAEACGKEKADRWESILGTWERKNTNIRFKRRSEFSKGSLKKKFISQRIPAFFREAVPVGIQNHKEVLFMKKLDQGSQWTVAGGQVIYKPVFFAPTPKDRPKDRSEAKEF